MNSTSPLVLGLTFIPLAMAAFFFGTKRPDSREARPFAAPGPGEALVPPSLSSQKAASPPSFPQWLPVNSSPARTFPAPPLLARNSLTSDRPGNPIPGPPNPGIISFLPNIPFVPTLPAFPLPITAPSGGGDQPFEALGAGGLATQEEISLLISGVDQALAALETKLIAEVFGDSLPLLGTGLNDAAGSGVSALHHVLGLKNALQSGLGTLTGSATSTKAQVEQALASALASANITVGALTLDASNPSDLKLTANTTRVFAAFSMPLDGTLGFPGLGMQTNGSANTAFTYTFNLQIGVDAQGFYLNTANNASSLSVGFTTTLPGLDASAMLSRLTFRITDESGADGDSVAPTMFGGSFAVDLLDPSGADNRLRVSEIGGDLLDATLTANAALNLNLASDLGSADFPAMFADLNLAWTFSNASVVPGDLNADFGARPTVAFRKVTLDLGSFFSDFAKPVLEEVREVSEPIQPLVDAMKEPIPLLTELNMITSYVPKSLLEMAVSSGTITQAQADRFDVLAKVIEISNSIPPGAGANVMIDLGDFDLGLADPRVPNFNLAGITPNKIRTAALAVLQHPIAQEFLQQTNAFPKEALPGGMMSKGMQFPILEMPETAFGLLLGRDVDLFTMDNATQSLSLYDIDEFVRLVGPFGFRFRGMGDVRLDFDFGFDTRGLLDFASSGDALDIFNGFYVLVPRDAGNQPISMAELNADFRASVAANVVAAEVGAGGSLFANARATLTDTDTDGRVHLQEFIANFDESPLCVLQASGSLDFGLQAYVTIGVGPFSYTYDYDFPVGRIFDFSHACETSPLPVLAHLQAGEAFLHLGPTAHLRVVGHLVDGPETFEIAHRSGAVGSELIGITFSGNGGTAGGSGSPDYGPVLGAIRGSGGENNDVIRLAPGILSPAILEGNAGIDRLVGAQGDDTLSGGSERDFLYGNSGGDTLLGGEGSDVLQGGPGGDLQDGGPGIDLVSFADSTGSVGINLTTGLHTGDAAGDTFLDVEQFEGSPFGDALIGDAGSNQFFGFTGDDRLEGRDGDDALEGGPGADQLLGGPGRDFTSYFFSPAGVNVNLETGVASGGDAQGDSLNSIEDLVGSEYNDTLTGTADDNSMAGLGGDDMINTGDGVNLVQGGEGKDSITGGSGNDTLYGEGPDTPGYPGPVDVDDPAYVAYLLYQRDDLNGGDGDNTIDGGEGSDTIISGNGKDRIFGGTGNDTISSGDGADYIEGQRDTDDINAGLGDDFVRVVPDVPFPPEPTLPFPQNLPYPRFEGNIMVGMGGDNLQGGPGSDTVDLSAMMIQGWTSLTTFNTFGVVVNLTTGAGANGAQECTIFGFENIIGTDAGDDLTGTDGPNIFEPGRGGGLYSHATGGPDYINGLGGVDTLVIDFSRADLVAAPGVYTNGFDIGRAGYDRYLSSSIEQLKITAASKNDMIYNAAAGYDDILDGMAGDDFIGGRAGSDILRGGEGNDSITANGAQSFDRYGVTDGHDVIDGGPGDDVIEDVAFQFGTGVPMLAAGTLLQIDGGPGHDRFSANFSNQTVPIIFNSAAPANWEFADGAYARNFEEIDTIITGPAADSLTQLGRVNNSFYMGGGDDVANPGLGFDTVVGGAGNDLLILDFSAGDDPELTGVSVDSFSRFFRSRAVAPFDTVDAVAVSEFERFHITGTTKNDYLPGTNSDDILIGGDGDDQLFGYDGNNIIDSGNGNDTIKTRTTLGPAWNDVIQAGSGNDSFEFVYGGPIANGYGVDDIDMGEGDDVLSDVVYNASFGTSYATASTRLRLNGGPGDDTLSADFGNQSQGMGFTEGRSNSAEFPDGSYFRSFEHLRFFTSGSGHDSFVFLGRAPQNLSCGQGHDVADMGLGVDTVFGGPGEDTLIVDWSLGDDANVGGAFYNGFAIVRNTVSTNAAIDFSYGLDFEHLHFTGGSKADNVPATNGSDVLKGYGGNDAFNAYGGADYLVGCETTGARGAAEIDQLIGGSGADVFVLGDMLGRYYDGGAGGTPGQDGYANITDFNPAEGDKLRLFGTGYRLGPSPIAGISGTALFHDSNGNGTLDPSDELIATLGTAALTPANTVDAALTPASPSIDATGLAKMQTTQQPGGAFSITFRLNETLPPDMVLEAEASRDLGVTDPWNVIAAKYPGNVWHGPATVVTGAPAGGKVAVTLTPNVQPPLQRRLFVRFRVRAL